MKTLKDMMCGICRTDECLCSDDECFYEEEEKSIVLTEELRQEAKRWVKWIRNSNTWKEENTPNRPLYLTEDGRMDAAHIIIHIFNLTEEDLK